MLATCGHWTKHCRKVIRPALGDTFQCEPKPFLSPRTTYPQVRVTFTLFPMEALPPAEAHVQLRPPLMHRAAVLMETDATCAQRPLPGTEHLIQDEPLDHAAAQAKQAHQCDTLHSLQPESESKPPEEVVETCAPAAEPYIVHGTLSSESVSPEVFSAEPVKPEAPATTTQPQIEGTVITGSKRQEQSSTDAAQSSCREREVLPGASEEPSAASRDTSQLLEGDCTAAHAQTQELPQVEEGTGFIAATSIDSPQAPTTSGPYAQSSNAMVLTQKPESLIVTLKWRTVQAPPAEQGGASPASDASVDMAVTPPSEKRTQTEEMQTAAPTRPLTPQRTNANQENFAPMRYGRERNARRAATKRFREPPTPKKAPSPQALEAERAVAPPQPKTEVKQAKRKASEQKEPAQKRRKGSEARSKPGSRRATLESVAMGQLLSLARQEPEPGQQRPKRDQESDESFADQVCEVLRVQSKARRADMGKRQALRILDLLELGTYPNDVEALFLTTEEATAKVAQGQFIKHIIVTTGQQRLPLQTVDQFLNEYYDEDALVWIQDPEVKPTKKAPITRQVKISQIKERFAAEPTNKPWNLLELATHCDDGLRPTFLSNEDCRLLTKLKIPESHAGAEARRRTYLPGYKEVEKWALVAEAGALTEPHQDSHGYSTFITVNTGLVGFGWLSDPSKAERDAWRRSPSTFRGGRWRYIVLKPGQTVYFPAGTVHFVFRLPAAGNTLAFGGHILRCSNIVHWVKTLIEERDQKEVTNEDLTNSAPGYLARVEKFVNQAKINGTMDKWGGEESIGEFLRLKTEFLSRKQK